MARAGRAGRHTEGRSRNPESGNDDDARRSRHAQGAHQSRHRYDRRHARRLRRLHPHPRSRNGRRSSGPQAPRSTEQLIGGACAIASRRCRRRARPCPSARFPTCTKSCRPSTERSVDRQEAEFERSDPWCPAAPGCSVSSRLQLVDDRARRLGRRDDHLPGHRLEARHAGLGERRDVGKPGTRNGDEMPSGRTLPACEHAGRRAEIAEHHRDVAGDHVVQRRQAAAIGHMRRLDAGHALEQLHEQMVRHARPDRGERHLAGIGLGIGDQLRHRLHRQVGLTISTNGVCAISASGMKSASGSYGRLL